MKAGDHRVTKAGMEVVIKRVTDSGVFVLFPSGLIHFVEARKVTNFLREIEPGGPPKVFNLTIMSDRLF